MCIYMYMYIYVYVWKEQHLFKKEIFCNITHLFTVTSDQINSSLLNKTINYIILCDII